MRRRREPLASGSRHEAPDRVTAERQRAEQESEYEELSDYVAGPPVDEMRKNRNKKDDGLRVKDAHDETLAHDSPSTGPKRLSFDHSSRPFSSVFDSLGAQLDEVEATANLQRQRQSARVLDQGRRRA